MTVLSEEHTLPNLYWNPKFDIINNKPIDDYLHVVMVISNPCNFKRRAKLALEFMERMKLEPNVILYAVEVVYGADFKFQVTESKNVRHLRIRTWQPPIWLKENMVNMGVDLLLPDNWKAMAWIDADIEFDSPHWASDTLKILNGSKDIVQLFSHCVDMDKDDEQMKIFASYGYQYSRNSEKEFWHPGYAWAMTRRAFDSLGGLYDLGILGSGDYNIAKSISNQGAESIHPNNSDGYKETLRIYQSKAKYLRLGYVPGLIRHYFHGSKKNRKYGDRWKILVKYQYDPFVHVTKNEFGLMVPTPECPPGLLDEIMEYFEERNEDE
jgi:hypothetical protein